MAIIDVVCWSCLSSKLTSQPTNKLCNVLYTPILPLIVVFVKCFRKNFCEKVRHRLAHAAFFLGELHHHQSMNSTCSEIRAAYSLRSFAS